MVTGKPCRAGARGLLVGGVVSLAVCLSTFPHASAEDSGAAADGAGATFHIHLLHVNDTHGHTRSFKTDKGHHPVGGYARLAALVEQRRGHAHDRGHVLFIHSGDELGQCDELTCKSEGQANFEVFHRMHLDIWVPGNHDFNFGLGVLLDRARQFKGTMLAANVTPTEHREEWRHRVKPSVVKTVGKVKIGFVGLCFLHGFQKKQLPVKWEEPVAAAKREIERLHHLPHAQRPDIVILVTHLGRDEDVKLVKQVRGVDAVLGGHSHTRLDSGELHQGADGYRVLIGQAGSFGRHLGEMTLEVKSRPGGGYQMVHHNSTYRLLPVDQSVHPSPEITRLLDHLCHQYGVAASHEGKHHYPNVCGKAKTAP